MKTSTPQQLGTKLKARRIFAGYESAQQFAHAIEMKPHAYRHYEAGRQYPRVVTLLRICRELQITPNDLLTSP